MTETHLNATVSLRAVLFTGSDDVLLVRRASDGGWELPGGRLNTGENTLRGLRREIDEETGLDPEVDQPVHTTAWENDAGNGRFAAYYRGYVDSHGVDLSSEHTDHRWVAPARALETLDGPQCRALERAMVGRETAAPDPPVAEEAEATE